MKKKLSDFILESKDQWELFKIEFSQEMDKLNKSFVDWK